MANFCEGMAWGLALSGLTLLALTMIYRPVIILGAPLVSTLKASLQAGHAISLCDAKITNFAAKLIY